MIMEQSLMLSVGIENGKGKKGVKVGGSEGINVTFL